MTVPTCPCILYFLYSSNNVSIIDASRIACGSTRCPQMIIIVHILKYTIRFVIMFSSHMQGIFQNNTKKINSNAYSLKRFLSVCIQVQSGKRLIPILLRKFQTAFEERFTTATLLIPSTTLGHGLFVLLYIMTFSVSDLLSNSFCVFSHYQYCLVSCCNLNLMCTTILLYICFFLCGYFVMYMSHLFSVQEVWSGKRVENDHIFQKICYTLQLALLIEIIENDRVMTWPLRLYYSFGSNKLYRTYKNQVGMRDIAQFRCLLDHFMCRTEMVPQTVLFGRH